MIDKVNITIPIITKCRLFSVISGRRIYALISQICTGADDWLVDNRDPAVYIGGVFRGFCLGWGAKKKLLIHRIKS